MPALTAPQMLARAAAGPARARPEALKAQLRAGPAPAHRKLQPAAAPRLARGRAVVTSATADAAPVRRASRRVTHTLS
jgi:hypothetical protein